MSTFDPSQNLMRARMLLSRYRYAEAERELGQVLAEAPEYQPALSTMAICLLAQDRNAEAEHMARRSIAANPEEPHAHYVLGLVLLEMDDLRGARQAADEASRLDPEDPDYHALRAGILLHAQRWQEAKAAAEEGLRHDPEHDECQHRLTAALTHLGRYDEADQQTSRSLRRNADDPNAHASHGWSLLHRRKPRQAMEAFREALRIEPGNDWAKSGMVEALKARNPIYAILLAYFLWMMRMPTGVRYGVLIGGYLLYRVVHSVARNQPDLYPWLLPLMVAYILFAVMTWIGVPMFNLLLRLDRFGRYALNENQIQSSNFFGCLLLVFLICLGVWAATGSIDWFNLMLIFGIMCLPASSWFSYRGQPVFTTIGLWLSATAAACLLGFTLSLANHPLGPTLMLMCIYSVLGLQIFIAFRGASRPAV